MAPPPRPEAGHARLRPHRSTAVAVSGGRAVLRARACRLARSDTRSMAGSALGALPLRTAWRGTEWARRCGLTTIVLHDRTGPVGRSEQLLTVRPLT